MDDDRRAERRTVLVVDDEPALRLLCRVNLELDGHRVLEAGSVAEAASALDEGGIDVVLLDMHLGNRSGLDVLDTVEALDLPVRVVLLSGTSEIPPHVHARVDGALGKPFTLEELAAAVGNDASGRLRDA